MFTVLFELFENDDHFYMLDEKASNNILHSDNLTTLLHIIFVIK